MDRTPRHKHLRQGSCPENPGDLAKRLGFLDLIIRDVLTDRTIATIPVARDGRVFSPLQLSPNGEFVCHGFAGDVFIYAVDTGQRVLQVRPKPTEKTEEGEAGAALNYTGFTTDSQYFCVEQLNGVPRSSI